MTSVQTIKHPSTLKFFFGSVSLEINAQTSSELLVRTLKCIRICYYFAVSFLCLVKLTLYYK